MKSKHGRCVQMTVQCERNTHITIKLSGHVTGCTAAFIFLVESLGVWTRRGVVAAERKIAMQRTSR